MKRLILASLIGISSLFAVNPNFKSNMEKFVYNMPKQSLSNQEIKDLLHMREEEKLARDVYLTLYQKWGLPVFRNIAKSERWHMQMVKFLLDKYGINDPVKSDKVGVFTNPHLQSLYNELVAKGSKSITDALKVGATIEDLDIYDLDEAMKRSDNNDIDFVYSRLRWGSTNHMRAFVRFLNRYGETYTPKYISQAEFEAILNRNSKVNRNNFKRFNNQLPPCLRYTK
ncbi:DUF2202 domain-containing protein [Caminibacter mediatlanticus TB-2]|uniref:DUF2202 domain-containing protein n=1 Tax=Caminibacter mediatlanticus TB-2 TaxID=391592 RepID=A0ABX5VB96_9BACT|nr:DUF2202 domain-containing protein [Caminibacter mediatlanticus]QCT93866.1 DUF2202 domain-containing protein [Caminibacter mediatlanticus TB-2]